MSLYHNHDHGHFEDITRKAGVETSRDYFGLSVLTSDFDNEGWPDFYVACNSSPRIFFHNKRNGTFEEIGLPTAVAVHEDGREQAGMGATAADCDNDGRLDIFKTNSRTTPARFIATSAMDHLPTSPRRPDSPSTPTASNGAPDFSISIRTATKTVSLPPGTLIRLSKTSRSAKNSSSPGSSSGSAAWTIFRYVPHKRAGHHNETFVTRDRSRRSR